MVNIKRVVNRPEYCMLWDGVDEKKVEKYIKILSRDRNQLTSEDSYKIRRALKIDDNLVNEIVNKIDDEIKLCRFYFEYLRMQKDRNFNKWVYLTKEQRKESGEEDWRINGDCWTRTNGKIRATIEITKKGVSTKIELRYGNNSTNITFYDNEYTYDRRFTEFNHRRTEKGINEQIGAYKRKAEKVFDELQYPRYCHEKKMMDILKELLHIGREGDQAIGLKGV